ncbi:sulfotransferase 1B1-like [Cydia fagiglandana]|uniref:sulfotransferase 1B1-like n=1 Tax=Cydia fagiglandana TaxID=1458189 RepID=UPI002FEE63EA
MADKVKFQALDEPTFESLFAGWSDLSRFGDAGYLLPTTYKDDADQFKTMKVRPDDVWVTTFPRSVHYTPFFAHLKEAWALRHHPNMLFIFYEELSKDLPSCIKRMATFLGKEVTDEQVVKLCEHLNIDNFRKNESVNLEWLTRRVGDPDAESFIRKGKSGGWREHFDEEMTAQAQQWMRENLSDCDLRFPGVDY